MTKEEICHWQSIILDGILDNILEKVGVDDDCDLYHYTSPDGLLGIVENGEMWFGNIMDLNDITEIDYAFKKVIIPVLNESKDLSNDSKKALMKRLDYVQKRFLLMPHNDRTVFYHTNIFVLSTSMNGNSHNLWNNYTKTTNRAGYAIFLKLKDWHDAFFNELEKDDEKSENKIKSFLLSGKVTYILSEQKALVEKFLSPIEEKIKGRGQVFSDILFDIVAQGLFILSIFMKDEDYSKEGEYRFVAVVADDAVSINKNETPRIKFVNVDGSIVSRLVMPFDIKKLKGLIVSPYMLDQTHVNNDLKFFLSKHGVRDFEIVTNVERKSR